MHWRFTLNSVKLFSVCFARCVMIWLFLEHNPGIIIDCIDLNFTKWTEFCKRSQFNQIKDGVTRLGISRLIFVLYNFISGILYFSIWYFVCSLVTSPVVTMEKISFLTVLIAFVICDVASVTDRSFSVRFAFSWKVYEMFNVSGKYVCFKSGLLQ